LRLRHDSITDSSTCIVGPRDNQSVRHHHTRSLRIRCRCVLTLWAGIYLGLWRMCASTSTRVFSLEAYSWLGFATTVAGAVSAMHKWTSTGTLRQRVGECDTNTLIRGAYTAQSPAFIASLSHCASLRVRLNRQERENRGPRIIFYPSFESTVQ